MEICEARKTKMNFGHFESHEEASVREEGMANGSSFNSNKQSTAPTASESLSEEDYAMDLDDGGNLASVQESTEAASPAARPTYKRKERIGQDGTFHPKSPPIKGKDGTFARPRGRNPEGFYWDAQRGVFAPRGGSKGGVSNDSSMNGDKKMAAVNGSAPDNEKPSSLSTDHASNGTSDDHKKSPLPASSFTNASEASSTSSSSDEKEGDHEKKRHHTRSKGGISIGRKSSGSQSDNGYRSAVSYHHSVML